ncbi:MAG: hypothetical protein K6G68_06385 [Oscillospiraceae bacterium]|nr:hypothetical protein [Oscillospiraceae bacterium]
MDTNRILRYLKAGHGRGYDTVQKDPEKYRTAVLEMCTKDMSYDIQCEGSRARYVFELSMLYDDVSPFIDAAVNRFLALSPDDSDHDMWHLCDLVFLYAFEYNNKAAENAVWEKYNALYGEMMTRRISARLNRVSSAHEYMALSFISLHRWEYAEMAARDVGAWFIRRRRADKEELRWDYCWLQSVMNEEFGEKEMKERLSHLSKTSKEIRRFFEIMYIEQQKPKRKGRKILTESEIRTLADDIINEPDNKTKSSLLSSFYYKNIQWLSDIGILIGFAESEDRDLSYHALKALAKQKNEKVGEYARKRLSEGDAAHIAKYLPMIVNNYRDSDEETILSILEGITIDDDNSSGWHSITIDMLNTNDDSLPDSLYIWIYENSFCSCCRFDAVEKIVKCGSFTDEMLTECLHDCDGDIRELAEKELKS